jgi:insulysin
VIVQSERIGEYLEERIEALWESFGATLAEMDDTDFDKEKESLASKLEEKPKSLSGEYVPTYSFPSAPVVT